MANKYEGGKYVNKVVYDGETLMDITDATVTADKVLRNYISYGADGSQVVGTSTYDADTSDATATASEILATKTAYVNGNKLTGTMTNNGAVAGTISTKAQQYTVPAGYHDGSGKVQISPTEQAKIIAGNIRQGVTILGIEGTVSPASDIDIEASKTATPSSSQQIILPSTGYDALAQVIVDPVPYVETDNAQGGKTVTIL